MVEPKLPPAPVAEPTRGPALPSTADTVPYVPVSWMAVGAAAVAGAFALLLLIGGLLANNQRRPLLWEWTLLLPIIAVVLSFAARRIIRNAEGTRTGVVANTIDLPNAAWWTAVVLGLGYAAYLFAINFSVSRDAKGEAERWVALLQKGETTRAFHRTRDPAERATTRPDDAAQLEGRYGNDFVAFRQTDLARLAARNPGKLDFAAGGLREWGLKDTGVDSVVAGTVTCPEGTFPVSLPLRGVEMGTKGEAGGGRQWQVSLPAAGAGYVQYNQRRLTPYGWLVVALERDGAGVAQRFIRDCGDRPARPYAYAYYAAAADPALAPLTAGGTAARLAAVGATAGMVWTPPPAIYKATADALYRLPGGGEPPAELKAKFLFAWDNLGLAPAGSRLRESPDTNPDVAVTDTAVEVRMPVEIPVAAAAKKDVLTARGRVVVACSDPAVVAEAKRLRDAANPAQGTAQPPEGPPRAFTWKVVRLESDLRGLSAKPSGPPAPGGGGFDD